MLWRGGWPVRRGGPPVRVSWLDRDLPPWMHVERAVAEALDVWLDEPVLVNEVQRHGRGICESDILSLRVELGACRLVRFRVRSGDESVVVLVRVAVVVV